MHKITLKNPIKISGEKTEKTITELNFREQTTAADYLSFDRLGGVEQRIALVALVAGTDESVIQRLTGVDYLRCSQYVEGLLMADEKEVNGDVPLTPAQAALQKK